MTFPRIGLVLSVCLGSLVMARGTVSAQEENTDNRLIVRLTVTDGSARPVSNAQALVVNETGNPQTKQWGSADDTGRISINESSLIRNRSFPVGLVQILVTAPGRGWAVESVDLSQSREYEITLPKGRSITMRLSRQDGASLPDDLEPLVFGRGWSVAAWISGVQYLDSDFVEDVFSASAVRRAGDVFTFDMPATPQPVWILINHPGYLRACQVGPISIEELATGVIDVELPAPATLRVTLSPREDAPAEYTGCGVEVRTVPELPDGKWDFRVAKRFVEAREFDPTFTDLAPGAYKVVGHTGEVSTDWNRDRSDYFMEQREATIASGTPGSVSFALETFDEQRIRRQISGDARAVITISDTDGSPAAGRPYRVSYYAARFNRDIVWSEGSLPDDGRIVLTDVPNPEQAALGVFVAGGFLGTLSFEDYGPDNAVEMSLLPHIGAAAPNITLTDLDTGNAFTLASLRGQVVLLEFWASWCVPCQEPMRHNNELMNTYADSWRGKVTIIAASIDEKIETIREHVDECGWTSVRQAFCGVGAWDSKPARTYGIRGVPSAVLIDQAGRIVWAGHPAELDVEKEINSLIGLGAE